ncbi:MAG: glycoside hydrolase family 29 (alpha-L-fucosidase), partial [Pedobacter sp.]
KNLLAKGTFTKAVSDNSYDIKLNKAQDFNCLVIQEDIRYGQRVSQFAVQVKENNEWKTVATSTTIGNKRIVYFPRTNSKEVRVAIQGTLAKPLIANVELYDTPAK